MNDQIPAGLTYDESRAVREWAERALPGGWRLADHPDHGRVLVVKVSGESAIYATPYKATGIRTRACMASRLTFMDTEPEEA